MKKLLFIEANTTGTGMIAIRKAKKFNLHPVFITNNPDRYTELHQQNCKVIICNTNDITHIKAAIDNHLKIEEIEGITTTSEFYIHIVSILIEMYDLHGNPSEVTRNVRNKAIVRDQLKDSNILYQPKYFVIESIQSLMDIKNSLSFPCIVKPVDDSGSNEVLKCCDFVNLKSHVQKILSVKKNVRKQDKIKLALIEEFVEGKEYSIETFSFKGSHQIIGITKKFVTNAPFFVERGHIFPTKDIDQDSDIVRKGVKEILDLLGWQNGPAHIEIKIKENKLFLVEVNGRLAGGMIPVLIKYATGLDLVEEQIKASAGIRPCLDKRFGQFAGIHFLVSDCSGIVTNITGMEILNKTEIKEVKRKVDIGDRVERAKDAYSRLGHIVATSSDHEKLINILNNSTNQIKIEMKEHILS